MSTSRRLRSRRAVLARMALAAGLTLSGRMAWGAAPAADAVDLREIAPGVWLKQGRAGAPDPENLGRIGNGGAIVGPDGTLVIDPGTSRAEGEALRAALAARGVPAPRWVLVTHTRPEFLFGAGAFQAAGARLVTHVQMAQLARSRCATCLANLRRDVGTEPLAGTEVPVPDQTFDSARWAVPGLGREVLALHFGHGSGPGDVALWDPASATLFAGGMADHRRIPDIVDSRLPAWMDALAQLQALKPRHVVPGHGPAGGPEVLADTLAYLQALDRSVRAAVDQGLSLMEAPEAVALPQFARWDQHDLIHRRNVSVLFLRVEREGLFGDSRQ